MRKKLINFKGGKGSISYGVIVPKTLLESIGCDLDNMKNVTVDIKLDPKTGKITIFDPKILKTDQSS